MCCNSIIYIVLHDIFFHIEFGNWFHDITTSFHGPALPCDSILDVPKWMNILTAKVYCSSEPHNFWGSMLPSRHSIELKIKQSGVWFLVPVMCRSVRQALHTTLPRATLLQWVPGTQIWGCFNSCRLHCCLSCQGKFQIWRTSHGCWNYKHL